MATIFKKGIDVSYAQGNIDFTKIDKSQVQFAIIRSSYGWESNQKDNQFERNYTGFKNLGIPVGVYHYSYARNASEGEEEADYCLSCIKGKSFEIPIYLDMEDSSVISAGKTNLTNAAIAFCKKIIAAGYKAGVYSFTSFADSYLDIDKIKKAGYSFWLAEWHDGNPSKDCDIWQYKVGSANTVKGISGEIDMDYLYNSVILSSKTTTTTVNNTATVDDKTKFLNQAKTYIGKNGSYVCKTKLKLGAVYDWCAFAVSAIMQDCGFIGKYIKSVFGGAGDIPRYSDSTYGTWFAKGSKTPQAGDLIFFRYSGVIPTDKYFSSHVGIVESASGNTITTLEGNVDGDNSNWAETSTFKRKTRYLNSSDVYAFYRPKWESNSTTKTNSSVNNDTTIKNTADTNIDVTYQVYTNGRWLPWVKNLEDFAGLENQAIQGIKIKVSKGHIKYRVKLIGADAYLPWVTDTEDYAGIIGKNIERVQIHYVGDGYKAQYRTSTLNSINYLPWVTEYNLTNDDGYAGITGVGIDKLQVKIVKK